VLWRERTEGERCTQHTLQLRDQATTFPFSTNLVMLISFCSSNLYVKPYGEIQVGRENWPQRSQVGGGDEIRFCCQVGMDTSQSH
jgi:hypothetical protein